MATNRAVLQVETAGAGFDAKKRLKLLFEPHIFYKQLGPGPKGEDAVKKGLAYPRAIWTRLWLGCKRKDSQW